MIHVAAVEQDHWCGTGCNEFTRDGKNKIAAVHVFTEARQRAVSQIRAVGFQFLCPSVEHLTESVAIALEADGILNHRRSDSRGRCFNHVETIRTTDAAAHYVTALNPKMVEQRKMVRCICIPAVSGTDGST